MVRPGRGAEARALQVHPGQGWREITESAEEMRCQRLSPKGHSFCRLCVNQVTIFVPTDQPERICRLEIVFAVVEGHAQILPGAFLLHDLAVLLEVTANCDVDAMGPQDIATGRDKGSCVLRKLHCHYSVLSAYNGDRIIQMTQKGPPFDPIWAKKCHI